jgi:ribosomal protein L14E/L6E/L27E
MALMHSIDQALVDAPDMVRCQINFKRLSLTDIKIDIKRVPKKSTLIKAMEEAGNDEPHVVDFFSNVVLYSSIF